MAPRGIGILAVGLSPPALVFSQQPRSLAERTYKVDVLQNVAGLVTEFFIDVFAYEYRSEAKNPMLPAIFKKGVEFFPDSSDAHARLASVYLGRGEKELALRHDEKAFALNPGNRNAAERIEALKK